MTQRHEAKLAALAVFVSKGEKLTKNNTTFSD